MPDALGECCLVVHRPERVLQLAQRCQRRQHALRHDGGERLDGVAPPLAVDAGAVEECVVRERRRGPLEAPARPLATPCRALPRHFHGARPPGAGALQRAAQALEPCSEPADSRARGEPRGAQALPVARECQLPELAGERRVLRLRRHGRAHHLELHFDFAGHAEVAAQATEPLARLRRARLRQEVAPQAEQSTQPARGHARVVHGFVVVAPADAAQGLAELVDTAAVVGGEVLRQRAGGSPGVGSHGDAGHAPSYWAASRVVPLPGGPAARGRRRISMTWRQSRSEMAGTSALPSSVMKPYSSASTSSWRITRSW